MKKSFIYLIPAIFLLAGCGKKISITINTNESTVAESTIEESIKDEGVKVQHDVEMLKAHVYYKIADDGNTIPQLSVEGNEKLNDIVNKINNDWVGGYYPRINLTRTDTSVFSALLATTVMNGSTDTKELLRGVNIDSNTGKELKIDDVLKDPVGLYDRIEKDNYLADEYGEDVDVVIGVGGGRVIDTAKGVASFLNKEYMTVPTVIATCAPYAPVAAVYNPDKTFREVGYFKRTAYACIADLDLLLESPKEYFVAGIGDTLAKWYEAVVLVERNNKYNDPLVRMGLEAAKITRDALLRDANGALEAMSTKTVTESFKHAVDTVFAISGAVGCFGVHYGRMAGAHAVHNGMSLVKETHKVLHGTKVSYGILVQLLAEGKKEEVERLIPFYKENDLAYNLACVNVVEDVEEKIEKIAEFAASEKESFKLAVDVCTPEVVATAMRQLEEMTK